MSDKKKFDPLKGKGAVDINEDPDLIFPEEPEAEPLLSRLTPEQLEAQLNETEDKLNKANMLAEEYKNQALRTLADLENVRKRSEKDVQNAHRYGLERIIPELLPIIDSLERGLDIAVSGNEFAQRIHEGLAMTLTLFLDTLAKFSVKPVNPLGEPFNPELHQAISMQEDPKAKPNTVLQVLQKGYLLNDRLLRPALVVVAKG